MIACGARVNVPLERYIIRHVNHVMLNVYNVIYDVKKNNVQCTVYDVKCKMCMCICLCMCLCMHMRMHVQKHNVNANVHMYMYMYMYMYM